jgi:tRNA pseudouridine13 synthase
VIPGSWRQAALEPPLGCGAGALAAGVLRASPEDFKVEEILGFEASGSGPHALLHVRKRDANTEWVARELARAARCKPFEVGFAGLKDRHAVTTQYFTVPRGTRGAGEFTAIRGEGFEVLSAQEHQRKLPRGALAGNRFEIVVRELRADPDALTARLANIRAQGVPNYFGEQRFGRDAGNLAAVWQEAQRLAEGTMQRRGRGRDDRGFMLSAARSLVFNAILAERVRESTWNRLETGDVANLDGRGSVFAVNEVDAAMLARCAAQEIHPTAPLIGSGESLAQGRVRALEEAVTAGFPEAVAVVQAERLKAERRALRVPVRNFAADIAGDSLTLRFELPAGSFATTVLREIIDSRPAGE